ncbi:hypothetical protein DL98DRAFT_316655 [Cadophora sp. DSE1049]|nr:hypothetical protein DL98DRAFT_316655 [Cadophora sp. DSE1049]
MHLYSRYARTKKSQNPTGHPSAVHFPPSKLAMQPVTTLNPAHKKGQSRLHQSPPLLFITTIPNWQSLHNSVFPVFLHKCDGPRYWPLGSPWMPNPWLCCGFLRGRDPRPTRLGSRSLPIPRRIHASLGLDGCSLKVRAEPWAWFVDGGLIGGDEEDQVREGEGRKQDPNSRG